MRVLSFSVSLLGASCLISLAAAPAGAADLRLVEKMRCVADDPATTAFIEPTLGLPIRTYLGKGTVVDIDLNERPAERVLIRGETFFRDCGQLSDADADTPIRSVGKSLRTAFLDALLPADRVLLADGVLVGCRTVDESWLFLLGNPRSARATMAPWPTTLVASGMDCD